MSVMLTLFHHSMPKWAGAYGGWTHPVCVEHFAQFAAIVVEHLGDLVDYWVPFNEPTVFVGLTYCAGAWPPGFPEPGPLTSGVCMMAPVIGNSSRAMASVALAHRAAAKAIRAKYTAPIGCAPRRARARGPPGAQPARHTDDATCMMCAVPFVLACAQRGAQHRVHVARGRAGRACVAAVGPAADDAVFRVHPRRH